MNKNINKVGIVGSASLESAVLHTAFSSIDAADLILIDDAKAEDRYFIKPYAYELAASALEIPLKGTHPPYKRTEPKISRNAPCPCDSGKKYKRCCGLK